MVTNGKTFREPLSLTLRRSSSSSSCALIVAKVGTIGFLFSDGRGSGGLREGARGEGKKNEGGRKKDDEEEDADACPRGSL